MRAALLCLVAVICLASPSLAQRVPDGPARAAMIAVFNKIIDIESRSNAIVRPADGTPRFSEVVVARDEALEKLRVDLVRNVSPQANAIKLPPFNVQDEGVKATYNTQSKLRDLVASLNDCIAQRQHWLGTGRRGGLEAVEASMRKQYQRYNAARDAIRKALLGP